MEIKINLSKKKENSRIVDCAQYLNKMGKGKNLIMRIMKEARRDLQRSWSNSGWDRGGWEKVDYDRINHDKDGYDRFS